MENIHLLRLGAWAVVALASAVQPLLRPARGDVVLSLAALVMAAGASGMLVSYIVANPGLVIGLRVGSIAALVASVTLYTVALIARKCGLG